MQHHIMYERAQHTPFEVASDPEAFADTYAELCGVIPIDGPGGAVRQGIP